MLALSLPATAWAQPHWVRVHDQRIPPGAVRGGHTATQELYVCRSHYRDGTHAGKVVAGRCHIGFGGKEISLDHYDVLVIGGAQGHWLPGHGSRVRYAVRGGHTSAGDLYVCRGYYKDGTHYGKEAGGRCLIGWGGSEVALSNYEVLSARLAHWAAAGPDRLPDGAVGGDKAGGWDLYVCRGRYRDGVHPGKYLDGRCYIGWGGQEIKLQNFEVLVIPGSVSWRKVRNRQVPPGCFKGGQAHGRSQCVCRGYYKDGVHVGKTWQGRCFIGWGGGEVALDDYEVMVVY
jgi:hypothetical protein